MMQRRRVLVPGADLDEHCHSERSEESGWGRGQMLRSAQHDMLTEKVINFDPN